MVRFVAHWLAVSVALAAAAYLLPGVRVHSAQALILGGLAIGLVNAVVRPILTWLTLPLTVLTLGLFLLVVNGAAFGIAAWLTPGFEVASLWQAMLGAVVVSLGSWFIDAALGTNRRPRRKRD
jgi:putative membrane protein